MYPCARGGACTIFRGEPHEKGNPMATETKLKLDAPVALQTVTPQEAAGLVPLKEEQRTALEEKVDDLVDALVATDANSTPFGPGRKSTRLNSSHSCDYSMPSPACNK